VNNGVTAAIDRQGTEIWMLTISGRVTGSTYGFGDISVGDPVYSEGITSVTVSVDVTSVVYVCWEAYTKEWSFCTNPECSGHEGSERYESIYSAMTLSWTIFYDEIISPEFFAPSEDFNSFYRSQERAAETAAINYTASIVNGFSGYMDIMVTCE
jgi:hypothetical protein